MMIEAMPCGTLVFAFRCGSIPEVIEDGVTGKVVEPKIKNTCLKSDPSSRERT